MQFHQDFQPGVPFPFHEPQEFTPEYVPEVVATCFIDNNVVIEYSKKTWLKRMLSLPKIAIFALESLSKVNNFANDLHGSVKNVENRISVLEDSQGDFKLLNERLFKVEQDSTKILELQLQIDSLTQKNRSITFGMIGMALLNLGLVAYFILK